MADVQKSIHKEPCQVAILTSKFRIEGTVHLLPHSRLTDLLNRPDLLFLPLTNVSVYTLSGDYIYENEFLSVNKDHIEFIAPVTTREQDILDLNRTLQGTENRSL